MYETGSATQATRPILTPRRLPRARGGLGVFHDWLYGHLRGRDQRLRGPWCLGHRGHRHCARLAVVRRIQRALPPRPGVGSNEPDAIDLAAERLQCRHSHHRRLRRRTSAADDLGQEICLKYSWLLAGGVDAIQPFLRFLLETLSRASRERAQGCIYDRLVRV